MKETAPMKTIGLLGGMSWESTAHYYRLINEGVKGRLGGLHSARIAMVSVDFAPLAVFMDDGNWQECANLLCQAARHIEQGGADCLLICTNTMHKVAEEVQAAIRIPLLHIAEAAGKKLYSDGHRTVGLLGTRFTMEETFYTNLLQEKHNLSVVVPGKGGRKEVDRIIFEELCRGEIQDTSRQTYLDIIHELQNKGAQAILAGCTEITMLVQQDHIDLPLYDTTVLHAEAALEFAFSQG